MIVNFFLKLKNISKETKKLFENILALSALQFINYILPLFTFPYLVRTLGIEQFGFFAFITSVISYFRIIIDYGFNLTATRDIAINQYNHRQLIQIFNSVIIIKFFLFLISALILLSITIFIKKFEYHQLLYFLAFMTLAGETFLPLWFFQGMEDMKYITAISAFSKLIYTLFIFYLINQPSDIYKIFLINSITNILISLHALRTIKIKYNIYFEKQSYITIWQHAYNTWSIFVSNISISLYTISATFILGIFTNNTVVGYFAAAEKIIHAFKVLATPISQALFPYINKNKQRDLNFTWKLSKYIFISTGLLSILIFIFAQDIIFFLMGKAYTNSITLLKIMSPLPLLIGLSNLFGIQTMLPFGKTKAFSKILFTGAIFGIFLSLFLVPSYHHIGSAITQLLVETFITFSMFIYIYFNIRKI